MSDVWCMTDAFAAHRGNLPGASWLPTGSPLPDSRSSARGEGAVGLLLLGATGLPRSSCRLKSLNARNASQMAVAHRNRA